MTILDPGMIDETTGSNTNRTSTMTEQGDKLTCATCGTEGVGIGFAHDCAIVLRVDPNDDELLTCWLCHGLAHIPCELSSTFYTRDGRATVGLHRCCYDRARVKTREPLRPLADETTEEK